MDNKEIIKEKKRIEWIDSIKFICMICIMIGHFEFFPQKVETFFSAFSLTGFLLCTGYTFHLEKSIFYFIRKRFKQIIVPMIWMGMLIILSRMVLSFNEHTFIIDAIFSSIIINNVVIQIFHGIIGTTIISVILIFISNLINKYFPFLVGRKR